MKTADYRPENFPPFLPQDDQALLELPSADRAPDLAPGESVTLVRSADGEGIVAVPESDLRKIDRIAEEMKENAGACEQCGEPFERRRSGGKAQRFCSIECRKAHYADHPTSQPTSPTSPTSQPTSPTSPTTLETLAPDGDDDFQWGANDAVALQEQHALAVYHNEFGGLVLRQQGTWQDDADTFIIIAKTNIAEFIEKICEVAGVPAFPATSG
jgi:hypothetical protein